METWIPVVEPGFEGAYEVSSLGRVRRSRATHGASVGRVRKLTVMESGYLSVPIYTNNTPRNVFVHRLVAEAFLGTSGGREVNHKNGVKSDNRPENLEFCTREENANHAFYVLRRRHKTVRLDEIAVAEIKGDQRWRRGSSSFYAKKFGVALCTIRRVRNGITWSGV